MHPFPKFCHYYLNLHAFVDTTKSRYMVLCTHQDPHHYSFVRSFQKCFHFSKHNWLTVHYSDCTIQHYLWGLIVGLSLSSSKLLYKVAWYNATDEFCLTAAEAVVLQQWHKNYLNMDQHSNLIKTSSKPSTNCHTLSL